MPVCPSCGAQGTGAFCQSCGANFATGKQKKGLSGCAIVAIVLAALAVLAVPIIGIVAAIAIPNFLNAVDRGKQKRTLADIRTVATAVESYAIDYNAYPEGASLNEVAPLLEPTYVKVLPRSDAWGQPFRLEVWDLDAERPGPDSYAIGSPGKMGEWERPGLSDYDPGATRRFTDDIVWRDGQFVRWPEGPQSN